MKNAMPCVFCALLLAAGGAFAAPPANLGGTQWTLQVNRDSVALVINSQGGPGAPGAANCRSINGTIGIAPIRGWYCPSTGRIQFVHKNLDSGVAMRVFTGNLSDDAAGQSVYIGGSASVLSASFGDLGETSFFAVRE